MDLNQLLDTLGYADSENLLRAGDRALETAPALGHVFRLAAAKRGLKAVYALRPPDENTGEPPVPIVYVCDADSDEEADKTHRLVWNQDVVPFILINTPKSVRLYSGFRYRRRERNAAEGLLRTLENTNQVLELAQTLGAEAIDDGRVWRAWGSQIRPEARVDWQLLGNLQKLDDWLQRNGLEQEVSHALIGKYVYLRYLRDRDMLSNRKLERWGITEREVFGREATIAGVERVIDRLDDWLNGGVFPLRFGAKDSPRQEHLRRVAATFVGDQPLDDGTWQLHLDFRAYDFSYIPIETLSVVYEQFLHAPSESMTSRGKEAGAYYTPIPVVNFMLAEMEGRKPLKRGMRVLDPSCGSGAFLVQCYRRLIEREFPPHAAAPGPIKLRELLQEHIFGIDRDPDACSVTELSLILTLLDYVDPPDLENDKRVKLPTLRNENIFCENFFAKDAKWHSLIAREKFDWLIGNPPWKKLNPDKLAKDDKTAWDFMVRVRKVGRPVGGNQLAQAFLWAASDCLSPPGCAGFLIPAMTLFEDPSRSFRSAFVAEHQLQSVANFSNLAEVLFRGRSKESRPRVASASVFFKLRKKKRAIADDEVIPTYTPFVANQEPTRPVAEGSRQDTWSLVVNASEIRDVPTAAVIHGSALPWKLAMWGSELDARLLNRIARKFSTTIGSLEEQGVLLVSEGLQLRKSGGGEDVDPIPEVMGKPMLDVGDLEQLRHFFAFPPGSLHPVAEEMAFCRKGRGRLPLSVCQPPLVIVSAARNFAVFSDDSIVVPPRQVGIVSPSNDRDLLITLSLYLSSDFAYYHQFFASSESGIKRPRATLSALREIPVPIDVLRGENGRPWVDLHRKLVEATNSRFNATAATLFAKGVEAIADEGLLEKLNELAYDALGLTELERALVQDLVEVRLALDDGKLGKSAVGPPSSADLKRYATQLRSELDGFVEGEVDFVHDVHVLTDEASGLVMIEQAKSNGRPHAVKTYRMGDAEAAELAAIRKRLRRERSQWVYFDRNLRIFEEGRTLVLKPLQRVHWTASQAVADAAEIIAGALNADGEEP